ncbi:hypothetical protein [Henriciella aquimarina]|uniref:hypothetical protein n=1 Tax=Henriciella aquimarina TaxID=545261 RepID=UPI0009FCE4DB|nr:hypothetical protein [Henriciella aquimarina]
MYIIRGLTRGHRPVSGTGRQSIIAAFRYLFLAIAASGAALAASAQLTVDKLWVDFDANSSGREDVLLKNESDRRYYIAVEPSEIVDPGLPSERRVEYEDPEELGLLISPNRLILDPGDVRALRIVSINGEVDEDRVYRVRVTPKIGAIKASGAEGEERGVNLVVLMAYDLLAIVRPQGARSEIESERTEDELILRNVGRSNALLVDGKACIGESENETCTPLPDTRLYAGAEVRFALPDPQAEVRIRARDRSYSDSRRLTF